MKKKFIISLGILILVILTLVILGSPLFTGAFTGTKKSFEFDDVGLHRPISVTFTRGISDFKMTPWLSIDVNKQYQNLRIKEMLYKWEGNTGIMSKGQHYILGVNSYDSLDGKYMCQVGRLDNIDPIKMFHGKKVGDEFKFYLKIGYSFDDEPENTQILEYNVKIYTGRHNAPIWNLLLALLMLIFGTARYGER